MLAGSFGGHFGSFKFFVTQVLFFWNLLGSSGTLWELCGYWKGFLVFILVFPDMGLFMSWVSIGS